MRHPKEPLVVVPQTLTELTGPVYPYGRIDTRDSDLTRQHEGEPLGERIIVQGRKGSRVGTKLLQGLVLHEADGRYTEAAEAVLRGGAALPLGAEMK